jgi:hypothetical protein
MFHLLKSVYVQTERLPENTRAQINISTSGGFERIGDSSLSQQGVQLGYAQSLNDMTPQQFKSLLVTAIEYPEKVIIFADNETYTRLFSILIKGLFPSITFAAFKRLFICRKASYDTHAINYADLYNGNGLGLVINSAVVSALYEAEEPLAQVIADIVDQAPELVSLEWRIARMLITDTIGNIPETLKNLLKRSAISTGQETASEWARHITDENTWGFSGCTEFSLLNSSNTMAACKNFSNLSNEVLTTAMASKADMPDEWVVEMLNECIAVLNQIGERTFALRCAEAIKHLEHLIDYDTVPECMGLITGLFDNGELTIQTNGQDVRKYDENAIRWIVQYDRQDLTTALGAIAW